jgi:preprotein translocase subunit SecD
MLEYPRWKYILVAAVLLLALLFALPNVFGEDPALQVARKDHTAVTPDAAQAVESFLKTHGVHFEKSYVDQGRLMVRFASVPDQLAARDAVNGNDDFKNSYITAVSFAPRTPEFLRALGLKPMPLGLDLRGGLYLLYQVDVNSAISQALEGYATDTRRALTGANIAFKDVTVGAGGQTSTIRIQLAPGADVAAARAALTQPLQGLGVTTSSETAGPVLEATMTSAQVRERQDYAIQQNITTLRNRVNELGVSEPIVQRQGIDRINVQLPGVQNSAEVKDILGRVATLEFRLEDMQNSAVEAAQLGRAPLGSKLYTHTRIGRPILLKREVIATGDQLTNATTGQSQEGPAVNVRLDARAGENMLRTTRANVNKRMAVVLIEKRPETVEVDGKQVTREVTDEDVINDATIRSVFSNNFQITGLQAGEARELALLLRAGSLATPLFPIEERAVGPSLGRENIDKGVTALIVGMAGVFLFMAFYYQVFGLVADLVLLANVVLLTALLSMMHQVLSLPGIAGILLTVGMAVDANVLIYERIREEVRKGVSPQAAIRAGFEKAF